MTHDNERMRRVLEAALRYARRGWPVFPVQSIVDGVCTCSSGAACGTPGKHPANGNGVHGATCHEGQIQQWFEGSRQLNIGIACGERSGLFALDFDAPEGEEWFKAITGESLSTFPTLKSRTGLKTQPGYVWRGWHLFFRWTTELGRFKNAAKSISGVDWRTTGGYVVVEPSVHASGTTYEWTGDGDDAQVADMPAEILRTLQASQQTPAHHPEAKVDSWTVQEGRRNDTLYRIGCGMRGRGEDHDEILRELLDVNRTRCFPPLSLSEVEATVASACKHPKGADGPQSAHQPTAMTDLWMARQFLRDWQGLVHWVPELGRWIHWHEREGVWRLDNEGQINQWFRETVTRIIRHFATKVGGNSELLKVLKRLTNFQNYKSEIAALSMATSEPNVPVSILRLDARPELLACGNCTIELESGRQRANHPADLITKKTRVPYLPAAKGSAFMRFLADTFPDPEIGRYVQRALGSALFGSVRDHHLHIAIGSGGNGKSTLLNAVMRVMGDHAITAPEGLLKAPTGRHSTDIVCLKGVRLAVAAESGESTVLDDEVVKRLTGGDQLTARKLYSDNITFTPTHHLWLMTNEEPRIGSVGRAMSRRLRLVPFDHEVPAGMEDVTLEDKLRNESEAILAWLVEGCGMYVANGLSFAPEAVLVATKEYLSDQDVIKRFMDANYRAASSPSQLPIADVHAAFCAHLSDASETSETRKQSISTRSLGGELRRLGYVVRKSSGNRSFLIGVAPI